MENRVIRNPKSKWEIFFLTFLYTIDSSIILQMIFFFLSFFLSNFFIDTFFFLLLLLEKRSGSSHFYLSILQQIVPWVNLLISRLESSCVPRSGTYFQYFSQILRIAGPGISSKGNGALSKICVSTFIVDTSNVVGDTSVVAVWSNRGIVSVRNDSSTEAVWDSVIDAAKIRAGEEEKGERKLNNLNNSGPCGKYLQRISELWRFKHFCPSFDPRDLDNFITEYCREIDIKLGNNRCILIGVY